MNITELKQQIVNKQFNKTYIFTGNEWLVMKIYCNQIAGKSNKNIAYLQDSAELMQKLRGISLLGKSNVFIIRDDKQLLDINNLEKLQNMLGDNILILIYDKIDKRSSLYKSLNKQICEFEQLNRATLLKYLSKEIKLSNRNLTMLADICEEDYGRCLLEINKIKHYNKEPDIAFKELLNNGAIYCPPKDAVFDLVDAILTRNSKRAYMWYEHCKEIGEANLVILTNLFNSTKQVLQVQSYSGSNVESATGLTAWQVKKAKEKACWFSNHELIAIMKLVQRTEEGIKTGKIEDSLSVDYVLEEIFGGDICKTTHN